MNRIWIIHLLEGCDLIDQGIQQQQHIIGIYIGELDEKVFRVIVFFVNNQEMTMGRGKRNEAMFFVNILGNCSLIISVALIFLKGFSTFRLQT